MDNQVQTSLIFAVKNNALFKKEKPYHTNYSLGNGIPNTNISFELVEGILVNNFRDLDITFEKNGFEVVELQSDMTYENFEEREIVENTYLTEVSECLKKKLKTSEVYIFDYQIRRQDPGFPFQRTESTGYSQPVGVAHIDYTQEDLKDRIRSLFGSKADSMLRKRYVAVNVWKLIKAPLVNWPIAMCAIDSVNRTNDCLPLDEVFRETVAEVYNMHYSPKHRWYYLRDQTLSEAIIFKQYDSAAPHAPGVPHCAFSLPGLKDSDDLRESIEVRTLVFMDDE